MVFILTEFNETAEVAFADGSVHYLDVYKDLPTRYPGVPVVNEQRVVKLVEAFLMDDMPGRLIIDKKNGQIKVTIV